MNMEEEHVIKEQKLPHFITAKVVDWIDLLSRYLKSKLCEDGFCCEVRDIRRAHC
jgi:hypothetical protein